MQTDQLIKALSTDCPPVRPLAHPAWRTVGWFAVSLVCVAVAVVAMGLRPDLASKLGNLKFQTEVGAAFLTSIMAAAAAFCAGCPGRPIWERFAPVPFLALWLGSLGEGCWSDWFHFGPAGLAIRPDLECLPFILAISILPSILIFLMIRRGAPIAPISTTGLAALAATSLAAAALRLVHSEDASIMVLFWQFGTVIALAGFEALFGPLLLRWKTREQVLPSYRTAH